ncbi:MAG: DNA double-strand break repair nuclease NurA [Deltaproteobacteria bacterium]|nr:DNA double-strand break repair nuclease NurA [Deltaproteobacteria bacterium]
MGDTFSDLPDALVRDLLAQATPVAERVSAHLNRLCQARTSIRQGVQAAGLIARKADLDVTREPSVVGIDGSYQVHRLTALDLCATAAVAVEGTSKEARRHWQEPYHRMWVNSFEHSKNATNALRGLMISMELELAAEAPHDLVLLDGSFIVFVIYLNQGLTSFREAPALLREEFQRRWSEQHVLDGLLALIESDRTVAVPKYSGRNELERFLREYDLPETDGKTLATIILEPDEYVTPLPIFHFGGEDTDYHLPGEYCPRERQDRMNRSIEDMRVVFYRPYGWVPAVRLEVTAPIAASQAKLSMVLEGIKRQVFSPAVTEPYPLFLADRMVRSLGAGVAVIEQTVAQHAVGVSADAEATLLCLQNYRTEGGRGGS